MSDYISVDQSLFAITTLIETKYVINGRISNFQATGFFYNETTHLPSNNSDGHWERLDKFWLVTNRHVVVENVDGIDYLPELFTFNLRKTNNDSIEWFPINLSTEDLVNTTLFHDNSTVDIAVIDVSDCIKEAINVNGTPRKDIVIPTTLTQDNLPNKQPITIEVTSDVIVASYPKGFYDKKNKFPIIKSGIIASGWNLHFNGEPIFQIDAQLFPGSSGGLVISKPTNITVHNGQALYHKGGKQFVLLGVYSGEYTWTDYIDIGFSELEQKRSFGLGNVWYSYLITEIINEGIKYNKS